jgi:tetratricopeptide (TPR) repeat protein
MVKKNHKDTTNLINLALLSKQQGNLVNARQHLEKAIKIDPENFVALNNMGSIYSATNKLDKAKNFFLKAIKAKPDYYSAIFNLALANEETGNKIEAINLYKEAIKHDSTNLGFYHNLYRINTAYFDDEKIQTIEKILKKENISNFNKASGFFILAYDQRKKENFKKEFKYLIEAHKSFHFSNETINNQVSFYWIRLMPKLIEKISFVQKEKLIKKIQPLFIVGLPRSGSTLIESIISSGKEIIPNGGETSIINRTLLDDNKNFFVNKDFLNETKKLDINPDSFCEKIISQYEALNLLDKNKNYVLTDKSLENFFFIEIIIKLLPDAKIINCERDIFQIIISIFQNFLSNIKWSHSIDNILEYIDNYLKIIAKFKKKYPDRIHTIKLEDFVKDSENSSKALFKFCKLDWDSKCLEFYKRNDLISKTASNQQVRNKIFINDEKKYAPYKEFFNSYAAKYKWLKELL